MTQFNASVGKRRPAWALLIVVITAFGALMWSRHGSAPSTVSRRPEPTALPPQPQASASGSFAERIEDAEKFEATPTVAEHLSEYDGAATFWGKVVNCDGTSVVGAQVIGLPWSRGTFGPIQRFALTDERGEFTFKDVGGWFRVVVTKDGYFRLDRKIEEPELLSRSEPSIMTLKAMELGELEIRLVPPAGSVVKRGMDVLVEPRMGSPGAHEAFWACGVTPPATGLAAPVGVNGMTTIQVPSGFGLRIIAREGAAMLASDDIEPLDRGERRRVALDLPTECRVPIVFRRASDHSQIRWSDRPEEDRFCGFFDYSWGPSLEEATSDVPPLRKRCFSSQVGDFLRLPGPGALHYSWTDRGFEAREETIEVAPGIPIIVEVNERRPLTLALTNENGLPLRLRFDEYFAAGSGVSPPPLKYLPDLQFAAWPVEEAAPPFERGLASLSGGNTARVELTRGDGIIEFRSARMYLPDRDMMVGGYVDGILAASAVVPRADSDARIAVRFPAPKTGTLRFASVDSRTRQPITSYDVELDQIEPIGRDRTWNRIHLKKSELGEFEIAKIPAGSYDLRIPWDMDQPYAHWQRVEIEPQKVTDLGVLSLAPPGEIGVLVIDPDGRPVPGARLTVYSEELRSYAHRRVGRSPEDDEWRSDRRGEAMIRVCCGVMRIDVAAPGFVATSEQVEITPERRSECLLQLEAGVLAQLDSQLLQRLENSAASGNVVSVFDRNSSRHYGDIDPRAPREIMLPVGVGVRIECSNAEGDSTFSIEAHEQNRLVIADERR